MPTRRYASTAHPRTAHRGHTSGRPATAPSVARRVERAQRGWTGVFGCDVAGARRRSHHGHRRTASHERAGARRVRCAYPRSSLVRRRRIGGAQDRTVAVGAAGDGAPRPAGTLKVSVTEYVPTAYVQVQGGVMLIAASGHVIGRARVAPPGAVKVVGVREAPARGSSSRRPMLRVSSGSCRRLSRNRSPASTSAATASRST